MSGREKARLKNTFDLVREVHKAELQNVKQPPEPAHRFEVTLEPAGFTAEKYELFKNYQQTVHNEGPDEISQSGFKRFLCESPLKRTSQIVNGKEQLLGSYHQCYRLDGRLIAMGVLDLLPHCVSGVYMLYHSDFAEWQFGKLSALREAALALEGGYQYYYMGYYIHSCTKMKYKGDYKTQHVLDPESYEWHPLDGELRSLLDKKKYVSMSRERRRQKEEAAEQDDYSDYPLPTAAQAGEAVAKGMSLFELKVPGVMTAEEIEEKIDLATMPIRVGGRMAELQVRRRQARVFIEKLWLTVDRILYHGRVVICGILGRSKALLERWLHAWVLKLHGKLWSSWGRWRMHCDRIKSDVSLWLDLNVSNRIIGSDSKVQKHDQ
jgi:arginine-tRNA-protein transferase